MCSKFLSDNYQEYSDIKVLHKDLMGMLDKEGVTSLDEGQIEKLNDPILMRSCKSTKSRRQSCKSWLQRSPEEIDSTTSDVKSRGIVNKFEAGFI